MGATSIEWTDRSINPIRARLGEHVGHYCEKVSPGCKNCYSSRFQPRFGMPEFQERRAGVEPFLDAERLAEVLRRKKPTKWFWCDMTDMFGEWVPNEWIAACFGVMAATPQHTHQVLTKRADRMRKWFAWAAEAGEELLAQVNETPPGGSPVPGACAMANQRSGSEMIDGDDWRAAMKVPWPLPNVWLMVSAEDQRRADERIPILLKTPAAVRGVSLEPLLEPVRIPQYLSRAVPAVVDQVRGDGTFTVKVTGPARPGLDWVIAGAESGPGARPMNEDWVRSIRDQCDAAGVAFFYKQRLDARGRKVGLPVLDGRLHAEWPACR